MAPLLRRDLLFSLAGLIGAAALPTEVLATVGGKEPALLPAASRQLLYAFADTLIPATDTPGAIKAGVPAKAEAMLRDWASPERRDRLLAALGKVDQAARTSTGKPLAALTPAARHAMLSTYDATQFAIAPDYRELRELVIVLYYLSEPGATIELRYEHAPGAWEPSLPLTPATRAWGGLVSK